jgi:hypothetical protein
MRVGHLIQPSWMTLNVRPSLCLSGGGIRTYLSESRLCQRYIPTLSLDKIETIMIGITMSNFERLYVAPGSVAYGSKH